MADTKWYDEGLRPRILINWDSFEDHGIPSNWRGPFTDAVINAYTRWMNVAGIDLRFQFWGYTTKTSSGNGELLIKMNEKHANSTRLASTFGSYNKLEIVFHRKRGSDLTPWNFVPYNADSGEFDMQGILKHELGHCLGLDHSSNSDETMFGSYEYHRYRFGPFDGDVQRVRDLYADFTDNRLHQLRTTNGGASWSSANNDLTSYGNRHARTNLNPGAVATPQSGWYVVGWSLMGNAPTWLRGDGTTFPKRHWLLYGGERSIYGPAYASDDNHTMLWAWVDNDDDGTIKLTRSTNDGYQWSWTGTPANASTFGTPGLCWTRVNGQSTWILVWSRFDRSNRAETGKLYASVSTNDGRSWSTPAALSDFYKALSGVSVAATDSNDIVVAFAWAPHSTSAYGMNRIRSFNCEVDGNELKHRSTGFTNETTRIQPALTYDEGEDRFIMAWRGQDFNTTLNTMWKTASATSWTGKVHLSNTRSHTAPALAYSSEHDETVMWHAFESS